MSATRRNVLGAALAAPLLAQFAGTASAADEKYGTVSDGWVEVRWSHPVQAELDRMGAVVEAVAPAEMVKSSGGPAVRFPVRSGKGDPSLTKLPKAKGNGALDGGVSVRSPLGNVLLTDLEGALKDELASGKCKVNGLAVEHTSALRCGAEKGKLSTDKVPVGQPLKVRLSEVPLYATAEMLEAYTATFGTSTFSEDTVLGYVTVTGTYTPPKP
ncbi:hypothetical protein AMK21_24740 [Streptomyces sp. CB00316]|uniref:hypothetical protein n=1 Tax=unclassified Streptomyces TaxID=2593676 RepID=UPI00093C1D5D|nr:MULTISPECIES: hypothetical protein [unclassified Streptomyces]MBT2425992.1 hypothetical protein [Streptomyces sp. ISL-112]MBT2465374.1 hypothetical protein [Streptomyces sp. ISL-63]OKJ17517.1 hypothetical protein AMK21_24740 [Streptomyces sp. CB00316]